MLITDQSLIWSGVAVLPGPEDLSVNSLSFSVLVFDLLDCCVTDLHVGFCNSHHVFGGNVGRQPRYSAVVKCPVPPPVAMISLKSKTDRRDNRDLIV